MLKPMHVHVRMLKPMHTNMNMNIMLKRIHIYLLPLYLQIHLQMRRRKSDHTSQKQSPGVYICAQNMYRSNIILYI